MYRHTHYSRPVFGFGRAWTPMVRILILVNGGVFVAQLLSGGALSAFFGLDTGRPFEIWRLASYLFLHGGVLHLLFNMFALWIFGSDLEEHFGPGKFLRYYFFTGVGAGICVVLIDLVTGGRSLVIGASGAVFGLLLAYGVIYAERTITLLLFFVLPLTMKARHFVILFGVVELLFGVSAMGPGGQVSQVAHFAHLGGMLFGWLFLKTPLGAVAAGSPPLFRSLREKYETARRRIDDERMDELLRKVNCDGIQSLTAEEKEFLHRMSRSKRWH